MLTNQAIIKQINEKTKNKPLFYITPYKERATGLEDLLKNYQIIVSADKKSENTAEIIEKNTFSAGYLVVFKNNAKISRLCRQKKLQLINPHWQLAEKYENKINQYYWLQKIISQNLPATLIIRPQKSSFQKICSFLNLPFVVQFNRSHTGEGTFLIYREHQWQELAKKYPLREIKCVQFIKGSTITINVCVWPFKKSKMRGCILVGNPSYQITGLKEFTDLPFSTVGNDWHLAGKILSKSDFKKIRKLCEKIGRAMLKEGWRGLFGLDFIKDKNKKWLVIEINARQPASSGLETLLQRQSGKGLTILAAHFAALLKLTPNHRNQKISLQKIKTGAQIIFRKKKKNNFKIKELRDNNLKIIKTDVKTIKHNAERFRIQRLKGGWVKNSSRLNNFGKKLLT